MCIVNHLPIYFYLLAFAEQKEGRKIFIHTYKTVVAKGKIRYGL